MMSRDMSKMVNEFIFANTLSGISGVGQQTCQPTEIRLLEGETDSSVSMQREGSKETMGCDPNVEQALPTNMLDSVVVCSAAMEDGENVGIRTENMATFCTEGIEESNKTLTMEAGNVNETFTATNIRITEKEGIVGGQEEEGSVASGRIIEETANLFRTLNAVHLDITCGSDGMENVNCKEMIPFFDKEITNAETRDLPPDSNKVLVAQKQLSEQDKAIDAISPRIQQLFKSLEHDKVTDAVKEKHQSKGDRKVIGMRQKLGLHIDSDLRIKERKGSSNLVYPKVCFTYSNVIVLGRTP